jgi:hypothetical protein
LKKIHQLIKEEAEFAELQRDAPSLISAMQRRVIVGRSSSSELKTRLFRLFQMFQAMAVMIVEASKLEKEERRRSSRQ